MNRTDKELGYDAAYQWKHAMEWLARGHAVTLTGGVINIRRPYHGKDFQYRIWVNVDAYRVCVEVELTELTPAEVVKKFSGLKLENGHVVIGKKV